MRPLRSSGLSGEPGTGAVADAPPVEGAQDVAPPLGAPAVPAGPGTADPDRMRRDLKNALVAMVTEAPEPLRMAFAASKLRARFGPEVTAEQWAGTGGFKAFVQSVADGQLACRIRGVVGFVYQPERHDIDAAMAIAEESSTHLRVPQDTERFAGLWADAADLPHGSVTSTAPRIRA